MDDDMKAIARKGYEKAGAVLLNGWALWVYAACEAVLAEQKRREAPQMTAAERDAFTRAQQEFDNGETVPAPAQQMDATMADAVRHPAQQASLEELTPDELSRFRQRLNIPAELVRQPAPNEPRMDQVFLAQAAAALAVAREGWVPASELERVEKKLVLWGNRMCELNDENAELKQQLATMYSLEQIDKAIYAEIADGRLIYRVRARLTAKQQQTEQEPAKWVNISYRVDVMGSTCVVCGAVISDQLAHTEWHNNLLAALGKGGK